MTAPFPDAATLREIVSLAVTAPSIHNTQPWLWRVDAGTALHLRADLSRQLLYADPHRRGLFVSCGAALHTAQVAAAALGWSASVERDPEVAATGHVATLTFWPRTRTPEDVALAEAARGRRTDRREVTSWPVPQGWFDRLRRVAAEHHVTATGDLTDEDRRAVGRQLSAAARRQSMNDAYLDELMAWTHSPGSEGIPPANLPDRQVADRLVAAEAPTRFPAGRLTDHDEGADHTQWLVLSTIDDEPASWLRTGEALSAVWLYGLTQGLSVVPYTQAIEVDSARDALRAAVLKGQGFPQVLLRIGWPPLGRAGPPPTPRRPLEEVSET